MVNCNKIKPVLWTRKRTLTNHSLIQDYGSTFGNRRVGSLNARKNWNPFLFFLFSSLGFERQRKKTFFFFFRILLAVRFLFQPWERAKVFLFITFEYMPWVIKRFSFQNFFKFKSLYPYGIWIISGKGEWKNVLVQRTLAKSILVIINSYSK